MLAALTACLTLATKKVPWPLWKYDFHISVPLYFFKSRFGRELKQLTIFDEPPIKEWLVLRTFRHLLIIVDQSYQSGRNLLQASLEIYKSFHVNQFFLFDTFMQGRRAEEQSKNIDITIKYELQCYCTIEVRSKYIPRMN